MFILLLFVFVGCEEEDSDNDGVVDANDLCLNTPLNETVDANGCSTNQLEDDDNDGIPNWAECEKESIETSKTEVIFRLPREDVNRLQALVSDDDKLTFEFGEMLAKYYKFEHPTISYEDFITAINTIEFCACGDLSPVLVSFDATFDIETKLDNLKKDTSEEGVEGDINFNFTLLPNETPNIASNFELTPSPSELKGIKESFYKSSPNVIAILDTGVDLLGQYSTDGTTAGATEFIYKSSAAANDCISAYDGTGWNFVNNTYNFYDDHTGIGHGTLVTKTLTNELEQLGVTDYSILPLKVFNDQGKGSYWKINCAMAYLTEIQETTKSQNNSGDIKIINASFGGSFGGLKADELGVMKSFIDGFEDSAIFVASAGNCGYDTDAASNHFPSGYTSDNLVSVGGYALDENNEIQKDVFSNYGLKSIDLAAPFTLTQLEVYLLSNNGTKTLAGTKVKGTSFSTPLVSAKLFEILINEPTLIPKDAIQKLYSDGNTVPEENLNLYFKEARIYQALQK